MSNPNRFRSLPGAALLLGLVLSPAAVAEETVDLDMVNRIREEGFQRSQVMETTSYLTDVIGPRLTGSPQSKKAQEWTRDRMAEWGLENAHLEGFDFGEGWTFSRASVHMVEPHQTPLEALPKAWTPGTKKAVRGKVKKLRLESEEQFEEHKGKLKGMILLVDDMAEPARMDLGYFVRYDDELLDERMEFRIPSDQYRNWRKRARKHAAFRQALNEFLVEEKVAAVIDASSWARGIVRTGGAGSGGDPEKSRGVPSLTMTQEHYNWILRLLERDQEVELEIDVSARFHDDDLQTYNTFAEIPGSEKPEEIVLLGGHLDSWHPATGATDNAAACAVMMEAARILKAVGADMKRTVRVGLWSGEEQGLLGSRAYVETHLADRPEPEDEEELALPARYRTPTWPIQPKAGHESFSVYFNLDNGGGKIRGIYAQENIAVVPLFKAWLEPLHDLGADRVNTNRTGGTDHLSFDAVGLPGFQFIQDPLDYFSRTHHTNLDTLDYVIEEDLKQAAVVVATFAYHAANLDSLMPRKPMPQKPPETEKKASDEDDDDGPRDRGRRGRRGGGGSAPGSGHEHGPR